MAINPSVRPIRTDEDLHAVLQEIDRIFDAEPGSADFDRLEVLTILAVDYENKHHPIEAPGPLKQSNSDLSRANLPGKTWNRPWVVEIGYLRY